LVLVALILAAGAALVLVPRDGANEDFTLGGPLLDLDMESVDTILLTMDGAQHRLERREGSLWTLAGAQNDWIDPLRLGYALAALGRAMGGRVLAGTEPGDRRYGFNGPESVQVVFLTDAGGEVRLALGTTNPVTGHVYASGAGRPGCFPVEADTRQRLRGLIETARLQTLLPDTPSDALTRVDVRRGAKRQEFLRQDGAWWQRVPSLTGPALPPLAVAYQNHYDDRRRRDDEGQLVLAHERDVDLFIYQIGQLRVQAFPPPRDVAAALDQWQLMPPLMEVALHGPGIDPDPSSGSPDMLAIGFGAPLDAQVVPAVRRSNPLLAGVKALEGLEKPAAAFVDVRALTVRPLRVDSYELATAAGPVLRGRREDRPFPNDGRKQWDRTLPVPGPDEEDPHDLLRNLVIDADRLPILAVLPPTTNRQVLKDEERVTLTLGWQADGRRLVLECGYLDPAQLPAGSDVLAPELDPHGPVGMWRPADGRLLQVPPTLLIAVRNITR